MSHPIANGPHGEVGEMQTKTVRGIFAQLWAADMTSQRLKAVPLDASQSENLYLLT